MWNKVYYSVHIFISLNYTLKFFNVIIIMNWNINYKNEFSYWSKYKINLVPQLFSLLSLLVSIQSVLSLLIRLKHLQRRLKSIQKDCRPKTVKTHDILFKIRTILADKQNSIPSHISVESLATLSEIKCILETVLHQPTS